MKNKKSSNNKNILIKKIMIILCIGLLSLSFTIINKDIAFAKSGESNNVAGDINNIDVQNNSEQDYFETEYDSQNSKEPGDSYLNESSSNSARKNEQESIKKNEVKNNSDEKMDEDNSVRKYADSGFGSSYSGGSSSSSSSSSGGSYSGRSHSGGSYSGGSYSDDGNYLGFIAELIFFIIIYIIITQIGKKRIKHRNKPVDDSQIVNNIKQYIPNFDKIQFLNEGYRIYQDVQYAWMNFKLDDVKDEITDEMYNMYESQLATLEVKGEQNIMSGFNCDNPYIKDFSVENNTITITTRYTVEMYDYIINQSTGKVVRGTKDRKMKVVYEMKFRQTLNQNKKVDRCPNCGANVDMNTSAYCQYCGSKLVSENTKWVLTQKETLEQQWM